CRIIGVYNNSEAIKKAVMANLGVSVLSRRLVREEIETGRLIELTIPGLEFKRHFRLVHHKNKYLTRPMQDLISICCHSDEWL
ncbi:LysR substrate-binding domain-containing protein, partial [uncultured Megasphaera sp.]